ncbi:MULTISPECIES: hypothetical protein [Cytobacillus]|uniref:hypothetical protein n=1 Tax=Cytobacillus TaxID=2675230 RepID=UPI00203D5C2A|nr:MULTISPECIES: hypothetical protein [Cytobacillus]MCM3394860.1 hypothetical protein [Cytobacillus oceanisediminis]UQX56060.1 hypothetical protein M5V91_10765 [Cytobacillus pseudoceanisediminis]
METETKDVKNTNKILKWSAVGGLIVLMVITYMIGSNAGENAAQVKIDGEKVYYDELVKEIEKRSALVEELEKKSETYTKELVEIQTQWDERKPEFEEALAAVENRDAIKSETEELQKTIDSKNGEIKSINEKIKSKNNELASVEGKIKEKKEAPKVLSAGFFTVGEDIPEGRYKVVPNGGQGNFFVNDGMDVNIILGGGGFGESEYVFYAYEGDEIELTTSAKFIPVE